MKSVIFAALAAACAFGTLAQAANVNTTAVYDSLDSATPKTGHCYGTAGSADACYDTSKITLNPVQVYQDCVYTGGNTCNSLTVSAPIPKFAGAVTLECQGHSCP